CGYDGPFDYW
nr:immunoglobulin heavy chain junction region [Mus musculus]